MWGPLISIIAGVLQENQREQEARQQMISKLHADEARRINPRINMAPYDVAMFNRAQEAQRGQMVSSLLGKSVGGFLAAPSAPKDPPDYASLLSAPSLVTGNYGPGYGYGATSNFDLPGSNFQLQEPLLLR